MAPDKRQPKPPLPADPININMARKKELMALPGVGGKIAGNIVHAKRPFKDWADFQARVKFVGKEKVACIRLHAIIPTITTQHPREPSQPLSPPRSPPVNVKEFYDPVNDLPDDLAAHLLSFIDVRALLGRLRNVSHAWRDAIDSGPPAVWHDVSLPFLVLPDDRRGLTDGQLAEMVQKSRGNIWVLRAFYAIDISQQGLQFMSAFHDLRVLQIHLGEAHINTFNSVLSSFPLLENLLIYNSYSRHESQLTFPRLNHLKSVRCTGVSRVSGLRNLPVLYKLYCDKCAVDGDEWPASLKEVHITSDPGGVRPEVVARIAALQRPIKIWTDWSFALSRHSDGLHFFTPPFDQLSFLSTFSTLQRFRVDGSGSARSRPDVITNYLGAMTSLRKLTFISFQGGGDLPCLAQLTNLEQVKFHYVGTTQGVLTHLSTIPNLTKLTLIETHSVKDYSRVSTCRHLRYLHIHSSFHMITDQEIAACTRLPHLEELLLYAGLADPDSFRHLCTIHSLRKLVVWPDTLSLFRTSPPIPPAAFAGLPALSSLEKLRVQPIEAIGELLDCLVQMPRLRAIALCNQLSREGEDRLRDALPRLQRLQLVKKAWDAEKPRAYLSIFRAKDC